MADMPTVGTVTASNAHESDARSSGGSRQWIRACSLTIEGASGSIDVSALRLRFAVRQSDNQAPNHANIIITNLKPETAKKIKQEGKRVTLTAGYQDSSGVIFSGEVFQVRIGRETPTETYLSILATDGEKGYSRATVNKTLAAGHTFRDQVDVAAKALKEHGIQLGHIDDLGSTKMPRARVLFGMAKDLLRRVGFATGTNWSIQGGKLQIVKDRGYLPGEAVVLNSRTGMIGLPVQTLTGIEVRCLLNHKIKVGQRVQINQSSIQEYQLSPSYSQAAQQGLVPGLADDGFYKVICVDHEGDTRGNEWYSDLICIKADGGISIVAAQRGLVNPNTQTVD